MRTDVYQSDKEDKRKATVICVLAAIYCFYYFVIPVDFVPGVFDELAIAGAALINLLYTYNKPAMEHPRFLMIVRLYIFFLLCGVIMSLVLLGIILF